jgi:16S rRNA (cytidine1402-2'-O)-methyltransferase
METKLWLCPTPIGNLQDITLRTLDALKNADVIACEDTRHSLKLLTHFEIKKPLISYHEHNLRSRGPELIRKMQGGTKIALISDAGMPGISDPGEHLVQLAIEAGIPFEVLPGPTAFSIALVASGLSTRRFFFEGFLPHDKKNRRERIAQLAKIEETLIFYASPHRLKGVLADLETGIGNRRIAVCRELTKKFEEVYRGTIVQAISAFESPRGEFVLVVEGAEHVEEVISKELIVSTMEEWALEGKSTKDLVKEAVSVFSVKKNEAYQWAMEIKEKSKGE